jgi:hypothetical protein
LREDAELRKGLRKGVLGVVVGVVVLVVLVWARAVAKER